MADFFGNLGKIISEKAEIVAKKTEEAVDVVAKKTEQTVEVQKIKNQIRTMEKNNERDLTDMGKMIYESFKKGEEVDERFKELCEAIKEREASIEEMNEEVAELKGKEVCPGCKSHVEAGAAFCSKCGAKVADSIFEEEEIIVEAEEVAEVEEVGFEEE